MYLEGLDIYRSRCGIGKSKGHCGLLTPMGCLSFQGREIPLKLRHHVLTASPQDADHPQPGLDGVGKYGSYQIKHESLQR